MATIDKEMSDKISFISFIIPEFALAYKMNIQNAYLYLKKYGGISAFVGVFTNKLPSELLVKTPTKAENLPKSVIFEH